MAAKKPAKKSTAKNSDASLEDRVIDALLSEAAAMGWRDVTLEGVAVAAGVPLGEMLARFPSKAHILLAFIGRVDAASAGAVKSIDAEESPRDRLFDLVMRRFDALQAHRDGARAVITGLWRDPVMSLCLLPRLRRSAAMTLAAAGISADGLRGLARIKGFKLVMAAALRAWVNDDTADMAKTMAAVDRALGYAERAEQFMKFRPGAKPQDAEAA